MKETLETIDIFTCNTRQFVHNVIVFLLVIDNNQMSSKCFAVGNSIIGVQDDVYELVTEILCRIIVKGGWTGFL